MNSPRLNRIAELRKELSNTHAPYLTGEDHENVSDRYQEALEIGWFKDELRDQIHSLEEMSDEDYNKSQEPEPPKAQQPEHGYTYLDENDQECWTDDYEQSIGE